MQTKTLASLPLGREAYITNIGVCGELRRRLLDLGFSSGNRVVPLCRSPLGDPTAYQVLDTVIALRYADAEQILVSVQKKGDF